MLKRRSASPARNVLRVGWSYPRDTKVHDLYYITHVEERIIVKPRTNVTGKYGCKNILKWQAAVNTPAPIPDCITDSEIFLPAK